MLSRMIRMFIFSIPQRRPSIFKEFFLIGIIIKIRTFKEVFLLGRVIKTFISSNLQRRPWIFKEFFNAW